MNKNVINKNTALLLAACLAFTLSACVTINIYFPAAAADKAADKIIEEVWQLKDGTEKNTAPKDPAPKDATQPVAPAQETAPTPAPDTK